MDFVQRLQSVRNFLKKYHYLWEMEIIERYPNKLNDKVLEWAKELESLNTDELLLFENNLELKNVSTEFAEFIEEIKRLTSFEKKEYDLPYKKMPLKVTKKKHHELQYIQEFLKDKKFKEALDFAGGMGHLSEMLHDEFHIPSTCIDFDQQLITSGKKRVKGKNINFLHQDISQTLNLKVHDETLCLGLHSCGPLSNYVMDFFHQSQAGSLLNFGCCYHKLTTEFNLSLASQDDPLPLTNHALNLAARSNAVIKEDDLEFRWKVKSYRYALHMFMIDNNLCNHFVTLGNAHPTDYEKTFAEYTKEQLVKVSITCLFSDEQLNNYFQEKLTAVKTYFYAGLTRMNLGRLIEVYIILDRAQYLKELGCEVHVYDFFEKSLSPRNLGLFAIKL